MMAETVTISLTDLEAYVNSAVNSVEEAINFSSITSNAVQREPEASEQDVLPVEVEEPVPVQEDEHPLNFSSIASNPVQREPEASEQYVSPVEVEESGPVEEDEHPINVSQQL